MIIAQGPSRRDTIAGFVALTAAATPCLAGSDAAGRIVELEHRAGGRLGVYAVDLSTGRTVAHRDNEAFKLESSFKGLLTAMVLDQVAHGKVLLAEPIHYGQNDLMAASPVTTAHASAGTLTVGELCAATMSTSDNAAANLLMRRLGGPPAVTAFVRSLGDAVTRIDHYEGMDVADPLADSTTPRAITQDLRRILLGTLLPQRERTLWTDWMRSNQHGQARLRAAFPSGWVSGDRTGTGDGICDDYAFAFRPRRAPLLVAAYYAAPGMDILAQEAVLREVGAIIVAWQS